MKEEVRERGSEPGKSVDAIAQLNPGSQYLN
jgi:hypothetical protein